MTRTLHFVCHSLPPLGAPAENVGGMQRVAAEWLDALAARTDIRLVPHVVRAPWSSIGRAAAGFFVSLAPTLLGACRRGDAVVFSSVTSALAALTALPLLRRRGVRILTMAHGLDVTFQNPAYQLGVRGVFRHVDEVLAVSRSTAELCTRRGCTRVSVLGNGMDPTRFVDAERTRGASDPFVLLGVGRLVPRKGFGWFVDAVMPRLPPDVRLEIVGDGPERDAVERAVEARGLEARVALHGRVDDDALRAAYARADLLVMPNVRVPGDVEGFGLVILEAALCGVPTLASGMEGMLDVVEDGESGWLACPSEPDAFVAAVLEARQDDVERARRGRAARALAHARAGFGPLTERLVSIAFGHEAEAGRLSA